MPDPSDTEFEKNLAGLAYSTLRDKAPALLDLMIGFQVLDQNEDQTKATGVFGCQVGQGLVYIPVFFLNGELKTAGMYLKDQDVFRPLEEGWVNYILSKKPYMFGEPGDVSDKDLARAGPDLQSFYSTPGVYGKSASFYLTGKGHKLSTLRIPCWVDDQPWTEPFRKAAAKSIKAAQYVKAAQRTDLTQFLRDNGKDSTRTLMACMLKSAEFGTSVQEFYPPSQLANIAYPKQASKDKNDHVDDHDYKDVTPYNKPKRPQLPDVNVLTLDSLETPGIDKGITEEEKTKIIRGEVVIKDHRENKSKTYPTDVSKSLTTATQTGIFKLLTKGYGLVDVLVIAAPLAVGGEGDVVIRSFTAVVLDDRAYANLPPSQITIKESGSERGNFLKFYDEEMTDADRMEEGEKYLLMTPDRRGTVPFEVLKKRKGPDGCLEMWVKDDTHDCSYGSATDLKRNCDKRPYVSSYGDWQSGRHILFTDRGGRMHNVGDTLVVPSTAKAFKVKNTKFPPVGSFLDAETFLLANNLVTPLKVYSHGSDDYEVTVGSLHSKNLSKVAALRHLVCQQGLDESDSKQLLKEAETVHVSRSYIQYADPYPILNLVKRAEPYLDNGPEAPPIPDTDYHSNINGYELESPSEWRSVIPSLTPNMGNRQLYNPDPRLDQNIYQTVTNAARSGQKDIFDTAVIGSLVKVIDSPGLVKKYLGDMSIGLDRVGRTLFLYYQHAEDFKEAHGEEDMEELEDSLKNVFKGLGDLVLFLQQRTVESSAELSGNDVDLGQTAS